MCKDNLHMLICRLEVQDSEKENVSIGTECWVKTYG
jgi:hypothetical protein